VCSNNDLDNLCNNVLSTFMEAQGCPVKVGKAQERRKVGQKVWSSKRWGFPMVCSSRRWPSPLVGQASGWQSRGWPGPGGLTVTLVGEWRPSPARAKLRILEARGVGDAKEMKPRVKAPGAPSPDGSASGNKNARGRICVFSCGVSTPVWSKVGRKPLGFSQGGACTRGGLAPHVWPSPW
jgi:hypothetical protein